MKKTIAVLAILPLFLLPMAFASSPANGFWQDKSLVGLTTTYGANGIIVEQATITGLISGSVFGEYTTYSTVTVYSQSYATYQATDVCTCSILGSSVTRFSFTETGTLTLNTQTGQYDLSSIAVAQDTVFPYNHLPSPWTYIQITLTGTLDPNTDLSSGSYSGTAS